MQDVYSKVTPSYGLTRVKNQIGMTVPALEAHPDPTAVADKSLRSLTGEEEALYDRQIRLWGVEAQRKLSTSSVLLVCNPASLLAQEIAKNIVLAGIAKLTLQVQTSNDTDGKPVDDGVRTGFLGPDEQSVMTGLRDMNPLVNVSVITEETTLSDFTVVCAIEAPLREELALNDRCRQANTPFMCGRVAGAVGWIFVDAGSPYEYATGKTNEEGNPIIESASYNPYKECIDAKWGGEVRRGEFGWHVATTLQQYEQEHGNMPTTSEEDMSRTEKLYRTLWEKKQGSHLQMEIVLRAARASACVLPPVTGIVGGMWGREAIKIVSGRGSPLNKSNFFFFNTATSVGSIERVGPKLV